MEESSSCYGCGHVTSKVSGQCSECGRRPRTAWQMRGFGWLQLAIGIYLVGLVWMITDNLAPLMLTLASGAGLPGEQFFLGLFGFVITLGLGCLLSGLWQFKTGRHNKWLSIVMLGLLVMFIFFTLSCGRRCAGCCGRKSFQGTSAR